MIGAVLDSALRSRAFGAVLVAHCGPGTARVAARAARGAAIRPLDLDAHGWDAESPAERGADLVVLVAATAADLRRAVPEADVSCTAAEVVVAVLASAPPAGRPLPSPPGAARWTNLIDLRVRRSPDGACSYTFSFTEPVEVAEVVGAVAHGMVGGRRDAAAPVPADAHRRALADTSWRGLSRPGAAGRALPRTTVADVPAVDERVVNPVGFTGKPKNRKGRLVSRSGRWVLEVGRSVRWRVPEDGAVSEVAVARLRDLRSVEVEWGRHSGPLAAVRAVAGLAAAGIPLVSGPAPRWADCLGGALHDLLGSVREADLEDDLVREEHSVRLRRAALRLHGASARWRRSVSGAAAEPAVSVVLCTRRPEMVGFALRQVARQRGVDVELVLALHGFGQDAPGVRSQVAAFRASGHAAVVFEAEPDAVFGSVLNAAIERAGGPLVAKMDDDDWYGPDHLADLVLARRYSGADLVGCATEYHHLEGPDVTVRRLVHSERFARHVTGAALLTDRAVLEEIGGIRPLGFGEDKALLEDVRRAGGSVYRTHGLGCVVRRRAEGHTWREPAGYFLQDPQRHWAGWRPSALLESDPEDAPGPARATTRQGSER
ncbi:glycosyltransferase involved in cell wall biosynthesis [Nocardiopsis sp. Huas11]|uniref:glycosyltransferase n=1 Tax=Nocardiopsis sp. Huas11 TaxID=2183912 RepID=UPI000EAF541A|nr:glycosyltransferase [Nocardiopsis sp. Huas11]RKS10751.1 glycosyltransferase involved in cell wall biosynthesis [Nocardiopsis sp. Huas11]